MKKILVIGSTTADIIVKVNHLPTTGEDVNALSQEMTIGGCAHNVAGVLRLFGVPHRLFSPVGTGMYGDFVRRHLTAEGLTDPILTADAPNGCCYCFVEASGERTFVCSRGAEYLFRKEWFDRIDCSQICGIYVCGLEIEEESGDVIIDFLEKNAEIPVLFAPGPRINTIDKMQMERLIRLNPSIHLNKDEVCSFTGTDSPKEGARALYEITGRPVVVTAGADGAWYCVDGKPVHSPPAHVPAVVDTIGAGDAHCGAFLACLSKGMEIGEAIKTANRTAALCVIQKGPMISRQTFMEAFPSHC